jgi:hypothetical protein
MWWPKNSPWRLTVLIGLAVAALLGSWYSGSDAPAVKAEPPKADTLPVPPNVDVYDPDPKHLWNRLYSLLYVGATKDGRRFGQDQLDPILRNGSRYLLTEPRFRQILAILDEFLTKDGEKLIRDPHKRAFFQRDLWAIFAWLARPPQPPADRNRLSAERRELRTRLARIILRVALSAEQIQALPDNYAAAMSAKAFPAKYDAGRSEAAFLPADLLEPDGPWVMLKQWTGQPPARQHMGFPSGRAAFFVLLRLPDGRQTTLAYLEKLRQFPDPVKVKDWHKTIRLSPDLPQFPAGTHMALVRQMLVIDDQANLVPTKLIEMVQLRVFGEVPRKEDFPPEQREFYDSLRSKGDVVYEFRLRRQRLFADQAGGLDALRLATLDLDMFFGGDTGQDPFLERQETPPDKLPAARQGALTFANACRSCHDRGPGIFSVQSHRETLNPRDPRHGFLDTNRKDQERDAIDWKRRHYTWAFLQGLLEGQGKK